MSPKGTSENKIPTKWLSNNLGIRGKGYYYEGEYFWDGWDFEGGLDGELSVSYGGDGGGGFIGCLGDATIEEH